MLAGDLPVCRSDFEPDDLACMGGIELSLRPLDRVIVHPGREVTKSNLSLDTGIFDHQGNITVDTMSIGTLKIVVNRLADTQCATLLYRDSYCKMLYPLCRGEGSKQ